MSDTFRTILFFIVILVIVLAIFYVQAQKNGSRQESDKEVFSTTRMDTTQKQKKYPRAKELVGIAGYVNTDGVTLQEYIGKNVILLDIMTYSCINCQRTFPYVNAWYEKYKDQGLQVIGVHTPEFSFEKDIENVRDAMERYGITFPVALDNDYQTWHAYNNRFWPHKFLIDIDGFVVYDHIGEGGYEQTERTIQALLKERMERLEIEGPVEKSVVEIEEAEEVQFSIGRSRETYFGTLRQSYPGFVINTDTEVTNFKEPKNIQTNTLYLVGDWILTPEYAEAASEDAKIIFRYNAEKVFLVAAADTPVNLKIVQDGEQLSDSTPVQGVHVNNGVVHVVNEQLYRLIEDPAGVSVHTLEIIVDSPGLRVYAFTFG